MRAAFYALGCKVNQYEADCYMRLFKEKGYEIGSFDEKCDVYVINTCSVTNIGDRKSRQIIRRAKKLNPSAIIVAAGCYAQTKAEDVSAMPEVDLVIGTSGRHMIAELVEAVRRGENANAVGDIMKERMYEELECEGMTERTRAYVKIQDGCDNFCSYCIIPYARGPVRSRKYENIMKEVRRLAQSGFEEIVLTGISVASYGKDLAENITLGDVIKGVCETEGVKRVRLSSISPKIFDDCFINLLAENEKICRHFHISLQSGSSSVLKRMNRKYTADEYMSTLAAIRKKMPDAAVTTDVICGFPEETEAEFEETVSFVKKAMFAKVHVFPYSERSSTAAARMPQIPMNVREDRARRLIKIAEKQREIFEKSFIGTYAKVLFEQEKDGQWEGLTGNNLRVYVKTREKVEGCIRDVMIKSRTGGKLIGELAKE